MIAVTGCTASYEKYADRLLATARENGLELVRFRFRDCDWVSATHAKIPVIQTAMKAFEDDVLWIDADSEVRRYPRELLSISKDGKCVYARSWGGYIWGCVQLWAHSDNSFRLLNEWWNLCRIYRSDSSDTNLWRVLRSGKHLGYEQLPPGVLGTVRPDVWGLPSVENPAIFHLGVSKQ